MDAIKHDVENNKVMLYMKVRGAILTTYTAPMCCMLLDTQLVCEAAPSSLQAAHAHPYDM